MKNTTRFRILETFNYWISSNSCQLPSYSQLCSTLLLTKVSENFAINHNHRRREAGATTKNEENFLHIIKFSFSVLNKSFWKGGKKTHTPSKSSIFCPFHGNTLFFRSDEDWLLNGEQRRFITFKMEIVCMKDEKLIFYAFASLN